MIQEQSNQSKYSRKMFDKFLKMARSENWYIIVPEDIDRYNEIVKTVFYSDDKITHDDVEFLNSICKRLEAEEEQRKIFNKHMSDINFLKNLQRIMK